MIKEVSYKKFLYHVKNMPGPVESVRPNALITNTNDLILVYEDNGSPPDQIDFVKIESEIINQLNMINNSIFVSMSDPDLDFFKTLDTKRYFKCIGVVGEHDFSADNLDWFKGLLTKYIKNKLKVELEHIFII